jgi:hypothetical protein
MANSWLRLWHELPNDPKWRTIARISKEPIPSVIAVYIHLLASASQSDPRGNVKAHPEDIASALDVETDCVLRIMDAMQDRVLNGELITGWEKRQPSREDSSSERTKNWRLRHNASRTNSDGRSAIVTQTNEKLSPFKQ